MGCPQAGRWPRRGLARRARRLGTKLTALAMAAALTLAVSSWRRRAGAGPRRAGGSSRRSAGRRLLVPAQPDRRRQPAAAGRAASGRSRCRTPSGCRAAGPTSASSTTRPTPASGATTSARGCTQAFGVLWPLVIAAARRRWPARAPPGPRPGPALGGRRGPLRHARLPLHAAQRRRRRGRPGGLRDQHPLRDPGPARRDHPAAAGRGPSAAMHRRRRCEWRLARRRCLSSWSLTNRADAVLRDPDRIFGLRRSRCSSSLIPAALLFAAQRAAPRAGVAGRRLRGTCPARRRDRLPVQRDYLRDRFRNADRRHEHPRHAPRLRLPLGPRRRGRPHRPRRHHRRLPPVRLLRHRPLQPRPLPRRRGPARRLQRDPDLRGFRAAVNDADLDYLVTAPFLNFIHPDDPIRSPEAGWLRGEPAVDPIERSGAGHRLAGARPARPGCVRPAQRAAPSTCPQHAGVG